MTKLCRSSFVAFVALCAIATGCGGKDDGAAVRTAGSVNIIGDPPPDGGGSVSAVGSGCTTKGATTKVVTGELRVNVYDSSIELPATAPAGVLEVVVFNRGSVPHELLMVKGASLAALPQAGGRVDESALPARTSWRVAVFPNNTICRGNFELDAGTYVFLDNTIPTGATASHASGGVVATITLT